MDRYNHFPACA